MATTQQPISIESVSHVSLVVEDQDQALDWFTEMLDFEKHDDEMFETPDGKAGRWLTVAPKSGTGPQISLEVADADFYDEEMLAELEAKLGTNTLWTLQTTDCKGTVEALRERGVTITEEPVEYPWGISAMIADPFGNEFHLMEYGEM